jgi:hypothetical protein
MEEGEFPVTGLALIVPPAPPTTNVAPEALPSPVIEAPMVKACVPFPSRTIEAGEVKLIAIGVSVMVAEVDWLGSLMLVAVSVAVVWDPITVVGAL